MKQIRRLDLRILSGANRHGAGCLSKFIGKCDHTEAEPMYGLSVESAQKQN